jgi:hypothetical protein
MRVMPTNVTSMVSAQEVDQLLGKRSEYWPDKYTCPRCGGAAKGFLEREVDHRALEAMELRDLTPHEAFAALNGLGFPDEQKCSLETVQALMVEQPLRRIIGSNVTGSERTIVDCLELWDGSKVYFGAAAEGAIIYRITRPVSYVAKVPEAAL